VSTASPQRQPTIPGVTVVEAHQRPAGVVLLDVREPTEWADGHVPGAVLQPLGQLDPTDLAASAAPVYVICRSGNRSATATCALVNAGVDAYNVVGGMTAWTEAGFPVSHD